MKKNIILRIVFVVLGSFCGKYIYKSKLIDTISNNKYYFLQEGVYSSLDMMKENTKNINYKTVEDINGKYYVYVGITKDKKVSRKLKKIYENNGYQLYEKKKAINNIEFDNNVGQFDLLINNSNDSDDIKTIEGVVLANYEEIMQSDSKIE